MSTMRKILSFACAVLMLCAIAVPSMLAASAENYIDNSSLIPKYRADKDVKIQNDGTPDWLSEAIFVEARIETCNGSAVSYPSGYTGTFEDAKKYIVDHYAEVGVNCVWLTPITERDSDNAYSNFGPNTIAKSICGTDDYTKGKAELKKFVDYAHSKNIRILLDIETWGVDLDAPLYKEHPELFYGKSSSWGGWGFDWNNNNTVKWMVDVLVDLAVDTGIDGYRCDVEPGTSGYKVYGKVKSALLDKGRKIICMSEHESTRTNNGEYVYDIAEWGVNATDGVGGMLTNTGINNIFYRKNIVDVIKNGEEIGLASIWKNGGDLTRYYTMMLSCHDNADALLKGKAVDAGYSGIFTPFIPLWWQGEEWNNPKQCGGTGVMYFCKMNRKKIDSNREFFETFKKYIRIRRTYPEIFQYFPECVMDANICKVSTKNGDDKLEAYARFAPNGGNAAVIVVPNTDDSFDITATVTVPYADAELKQGGTYVVTDLITGKKVTSGTKDSLQTFKAKVAPEACGVYYVTLEGGVKPTTAKTTAKPTTAKTTKSGDPTEAPITPATDEPAETEEPVETTEPAETEEPAETTEPVETEPETEPETVGDEPSFPLIPVIIGGVVLVAAVVVIIIVASKKKKA